MMANYLDANPVEALRLQSMAEIGGFVPIVRDGRIIFYDAPEILMKPASSITAEDYIVWLEVLGSRFTVTERDGARTFYETTPILDSTPADWLRLAEIIRGVFGQSRLHEAADFVTARDGVSA